MPHQDELLAEFGGGRSYCHVIDWRETSQTEIWHGYFGTVSNDLLLLGDHERGEDVLGRSGNDTIWGGGGGDRIHGNDGEDWLYGEEGDDWLGGDQGNDLLYGGEGDDHLFGGADHDQLYGDAGNDELHGGLGDDRLFGGEGDDFLEGGAGDDTLTGGEGDDTLMGWHGDDVFVFEADHGDDTIRDFADGEDVIDLSALTGITGIGNLTITQQGDDAKIDTGEGTITLLNFDVANLDASDFTFHGEAPQDGM